MKNKNTNPCAFLFNYKKYKGDQRKQKLERDGSNNILVMSQLISGFAKFDLYNSLSITVFKLILFEIKNTQQVLERLKKVNKYFLSMNSRSIQWIKYKNK